MLVKEGTDKDDTSQVVPSETGSIEATATRHGRRAHGGQNPYSKGDTGAAEALLMSDYTKTSISLPTE